MSVPFFLAGTAFRIYEWLRVPRSDMRLCIFSQKKPGTSRWLKLGKDLFIFPQVLDINRRMWVFIISLHLAGVALFVGHLRLIFEFTPLANALGSRGMEQFAFLTGGAIGIILVIAILYFLTRRIMSPNKDISAPEDYFLLTLILLVILTGNYLRFFGDIPVTAYRQYIDNLFSFNPYIPTVLATSATKWALGAHVMFANMLLIYFPLSKLVHFVGSFAANLVRSE